MCLCIEMCIDVHIGVCVDMRIDMCASRLCAHVQPSQRTALACALVQAHDDTLAWEWSTAGSQSFHRQSAIWGTHICMHACTHGCTRTHMHVCADARRHTGLEVRQGGLRWGKPGQSVVQGGLASTQTDVVCGREHVWWPCRVSIITCSDNE